MCMIMDNNNNNNNKTNVVNEKNKKIIRKKVNHVNKLETTNQQTKSNQSKLKNPKFIPLL